MSVCCRLYVCPLPMQVFLRPVIGGIWFSFQPSCQSRTGFRARTPCLPHLETEEETCSEIFLRSTPWPWHLWKEDLAPLYLEIKLKNALQESIELQAEADKAKTERQKSHEKAMQIRKQAIEENQNHRRKSIKSHENNILAKQIRIILFK